MTLITMKLGKDYNDEVIHIATDESEYWDASPLFYPYELRLMLMNNEPELIVNIINSKKELGGFLCGPGKKEFVPPKKTARKTKSKLSELVSKRNLKLKART